MMPLSSGHDLFIFLTQVPLPHGSFYLFIFRGEKGEEIQREKNVNVWLPLEHPLLGTWPATQACALTGS